jgi:hypothetical protein
LYLCIRYKLLNLARSYNKNVTTADVSGMASCVLLAALSIPPYDRSAAATTDAQAEVERERSARMASILGFSQVCLAVSCGLNRSMAIQMCALVQRTPLG